MSGGDIDFGGCMGCMNEGGTVGCIGAGAGEAKNALLAGAGVGASWKPPNSSSLSKEETTAGRALFAPGGGAGADEVAKSSSMPSKSRIGAGSGALGAGAGVDGVVAVRRI